MNALKGRLDGNLGIKSWELELRVQDLGGFSTFLAVRCEYIVEKQMGRNMENEMEAGNLVQ